jgi:hypothetical protein
MKANPNVECWFGRRRTFKRKLPSCVTLKSKYGKYLRAWPNGHVAFTASAAQSDERFQVMGGIISTGPLLGGVYSVEDNCYFKSHFGKFLSAHPDGTLNAGKKRGFSWEEFKVDIEEGGRYSLTSRHNMFVVAEKTGEANANRTDRRFLPTFQIASC